MADMAFKRSAVRSCLSPQKSLLLKEDQGFFLVFMSCEVGFSSVFIKRQILTCALDFRLKIMKQEGRYVWCSRYKQHGADSLYSKSDRHRIIHEGINHENMHIWQKRERLSLSLSSVHNEYPPET